MAGKSSSLSSEGDTGCSWAEGGQGVRLGTAALRGWELAASKAYPRMSRTGTRAGSVCITEKHLIIQKHARRLEERILT